MIHGRALAVCALLASACGAPAAIHDTLPPPPAEVSEVRRITERDPRSGAILREWEVLTLYEGKTVQHGRDLRWYPDGAKLSEASFRHGEPTGSMRRWYANGQLKSECSFDPDGAITPMRFWHENGILAAEGGARSGHREGLWTFWYPSGSKREEGGFVDGERSGLWSIHHVDGSLKSRGHYDDGVRIGPWSHYEEGRRPASGSPSAQ